jgi:hypothetical protein
MFMIQISKLLVTVGMTLTSSAQLTSISQQATDWAEVQEVQMCQAPCASDSMSLEDVSDLWLHCQESVCSEIKSVKFAKN